MSVEGKLFLNENDDGKVGMVWPAQNSGVCGKRSRRGEEEIEAREEREREEEEEEQNRRNATNGTGIDLSFLDQSPMLVVLPADDISHPITAERSCTTATTAPTNINNNNNNNIAAALARPPAAVPRNWLRGDALYNAVLRLLNSWDVKDPTVCTVFDRMDCHVLAPNIGSFQMLDTVRQYQVCEDEMFVYALALFRRFVLATGIPITHRNHNHIFFTCLSLANKTLNDSPFGVACFDQIARVTKGNFRKYEMIMLITLGWSIEVTDAELEVAHAMLF